jgi:hypothetical protein
MRDQLEVNANLVRELGDRLVLGQTEFSFALVQEMFTRSWNFKREQGHYWFTATIIGNSDNKIFAVHIMGDCGIDTYRAGEPMPIEAFGDWLGNSHRDYILSKGAEPKEFQWKAAVGDLKGYLERENDVDASKMLDRIGGEFAYPDCSDQVSFHKLVLETAEEVGYEIYDAVSDCRWGLRWSAWAESRHYQITYFGNWLKKQERDEGRTSAEMIISLPAL